MRRIRGGPRSEQPGMELEPGSVSRWTRERGLPRGLGPAVEKWVEDLEATTRSGKGIRSALFEVVYRASGGRDDQVCVRTARALELLHEALLVHDDLADGDDHRRGAPNLQGRTATRATVGGADAVSAGHLGRVGGLLGGDLLLVAAMGEVARLPVPKPTLHRVLEEVEIAVVAAAAGEFDDVHGSVIGQPADHERVLAIAEAKTAGYSVVLPLVLGAFLAGAPEESVESLREAGRLLGTAYQVIDDVLGVFGDPAITGKSTDADLLRRVPTVLLAHAASTGTWPRIEEALGGGAPDPAEARRLLEESGARDHALRTAAGLVDVARSVLADAAVPEDVRSALAPHLDTALERTR